MADEALILVGVGVGAELPAALPAFIADAPVAHAKRVRRPVGRPALGDRGATCVDSLAQLARSASAQITVEPGLGADQAAQLQKLVRPKRV